jgi:hypothetical protein
MKKPNIFQKFVAWIVLPKEWFEIYKNQPLGIKERGAKQ